MIDAVRRRLRFALVLVAACHGELVPLPDEDGVDDEVEPGADAGGGASPTWSADVAPRLASCTTCHGSAGRYSLESYEDSLGPGTDAVPNVVPRDASSALVDYCRRGHGAPTAADVALVERWIADGAPER